MSMIVIYNVLCLGYFMVDSAHKGPEMQTYDCFFVVTMKELLEKKTSQVTGKMVTGDTLAPTWHHPNISL